MRDMSDENFEFDLYEEEIGTQTNNDAHKTTCTEKIG